MNKLVSLLTIGAIFGGISPSLAQQHKRISPHETVSKVIDGNRVMVVYGRPYTKDPQSGAGRPKDLDSLAELKAILEDLGK